MPPNETAHRNHEQLFPGYVSKLAVSDPEFITFFRLMVQLAAIIAAQALREYRMMLGAALTVGVTPVEVKEILYQAVPYVGMAKVLAPGATPSSPRPRPR